MQIKRKKIKLIQILATKSDLPLMQETKIDDYRVFLQKKYIYLNLITLEKSRRFQVMSWQPF